MKRENSIIIDWLSFTTRIHTKEQVIEFLGLQDCEFQNTYGAKGYQERLYFESISIHYNGRSDMGVWVEMSGSGCRAFESYSDGDYSKIFKLVLDNPRETNLTRLDIAFDEYTEILDINKLCKHTLNDNYRSVAQYSECVQSTNGVSIQVGSSRSEVLIRIYDKLAERLSKTRNNSEKEKIRNEIPHWVRVELQLRDERALEFVRLIIDGRSIGEVYSGVVRHYLEYGAWYINSDGKSVFKCYAYWEKFLNSSENLSIYVAPGLDYNLENCINYVTNSAGNAVDCLLEIFGDKGFKKLIKNRAIEQKTKYISLIKKHKDNVNNGNGNKKYKNQL